MAESWSGRALFVAMILVAGAAGFCLLGADEHGTAHHGTTHHGMSLDLCAGLAIFSAAVTLAMFAQVYPVPVDPPYVVCAVSLHRLDPPPKSPSLS